MKTDSSPSADAPWERFAANLVLLTLLGIAAGASVAVGAPPKQAKVEFRLAFDKETYQRAEPINVTFSLVNQAGRPVWVNTRFHVRCDASQPEDREVLLRVTSPDGRPLACQRDYDVGFPKSDYFQLLKPGEEAAAEHPRDLRNLFDFKDAGAYTVTGTYQNVFGRELGLDAFEGPVTSRPAKMTVAEESP